MNIMSILTNNNDTFSFDVTPNFQKSYLNYSSSIEPVRIRNLHQRIFSNFLDRVVAEEALK